jgi:hypothetical protein
MLASSIRCLSDRDHGIIFVDFSTLQKAAAVNDQTSRALQRATSGEGVSQTSIANGARPGVCRTRTLSCNSGFAEFLVGYFIFPVDCVS